LIARFWEIAPRAEEIRSDFTFARGSRAAELSCGFQLIAAIETLWPALSGDASGRCRCSPEQYNATAAAFQARLLDRIDLQPGNAQRAFRLAGKTQGDLDSMYRAEQSE